MTIGLILPTCCLIFSIFLNVVYFTKERVDNYENKIYKCIIVINLVSLILEFPCTYFAFNNISIVSNMVIKFYLIILLAYIQLLTLYISIISKSQSFLVTNEKKLITGYAIFFLVLTIGVIFGNVEFVNSKYGAGAIGSSTTILVIQSIICAILWVINIAKAQNEHVNKKKFIPFVIYLVCSLGASAIQMNNPGLLLVTPAEMFVTMVMYFTIENPDVKMIEALQTARDQADKANQAKTDFLSSMSHEIRTPLNAIVGFSDYILTTETLDEAKENAKDIVNASNTLLEIVNGILDISKIEAGKLEIVNSKYSARNTFEGLAKLITPKMNEKGLDFSYYIAPDIPETLFGDHANIKKVVTNLLSNAYKYTDKGFVRYEVNCINSPNITKLIITVEDSGRGIKQKNIDKLFTKFQRLDEDKNTTIEGTGLGLAITKQLVELMGGKILVHTIYGEGSKFTIVLNQRIEYTPVEETKREVKTTLDLKDKRILIVDDNALNIKVATKILERYNANNIKSFDNGFSCIDDIKSGSKYDIILMDDMMPKMNGVETFKKLKQITDFNMPVVILTANAITGMKEKYMSEGFDEYLAKPIEKDELIRVFNTIFDKYNINTPEEVEQLEATEELEIIGEDTTEESNTEETSPETYLRNHEIDLDKALEFLGDMEMYNMTINDFLTEVEEKWQRITSYKTTNDMPNYAIEVHSLKSDAKYLGFMFLADIAYQHELKSKENDSKFVDIHFQELSDAYSKALTIAKTYKNMIK